MIRKAVKFFLLMLVPTAALTYARHVGRIPMETKEEKTFVL